MWLVYPTCSTADLPVTVRCWVSRPPFSVLKTKEAKKGEGLGFTLNSCNPSCGPPAVADRTPQIMRIFHQQNGAKKWMVIVPLKNWNRFQQRFKFSESDLSYPKKNGFSGFQSTILWSQLTKIGIWPPALKATATLGWNIHPFVAPNWAS